MPALTAIFSADGNPFRKELQATERVAQSSAKKIQKSLSETALHLEQQISSAKRAGVSYAGFETELTATKTQLALINAELAENATVQAASNSAVKNAIFPGANWRRVMQETLVVLREIARGNWTRVPSSISIIVQNLGTGLLKFIPALARLALGAVVVHNLARGFKAMAEGAEDALNRTANAVNRFQAMANAMRSAAERTRDFQYWLAKLHEPRESLSSSTQERIKLMREEFNLQQQFASKTGQTARQKADAEIAQDRKELAVLREAQAQADAKAKATEDRARRAQAAFPENRATDLSVFEADAQKQAEILAKVVSKETGTTVGGGSVSAAFKSNTLPQLLSTFGAPENRQIEYEDGKYTTLKQARESFEAAAKVAATTAETVRNAEDNIKEAREQAEKAATDRAELTKEITDRAARLALAQKYLPEIADVSGTAHVFRGGLDSRQQNGAFANPATISLIDVTKGQARDVKAIHETLKAALRSRGSNGGVKY